MKTYILSFLLIFGLAANIHGKPITEIYSLKDPVIAEEANVNDIPFNTWEIAVGAILGGDEVRLEEEEYVDDIPFDTRKTALKYILVQMKNASEESSVNDIPFNTEKVMYEELTARLTEQYRDEANCADMAETGTYQCSHDKTGVSYIIINSNKPGKMTFRQRKAGPYDYPIIVPVRIQIPEINLNKDDLNQEFLATPILPL